MRATQRLISRGFEAYLVGGCVRDLLLDRTPKDYDIATEARPPQVKRTFSRNCRIIGRRFKLAHLHFDNNTKILEVSTFRRSPQLENSEDDLLITRDNEFGNAEEDALRRDFTVNALFLDPTRNCILDYTNGLADLRARLIRTIGDPRVRFREDPVRILRAAKFAGRLGFQIEAETFAAMAETSGDLVRSAPPRLLEEILRLLRGGHALDSFQLLRDVGALKSLVPVLADFLGSARHDQRVHFWRLLEALDHQVHDGHVPQNAVLLGILLVCPVLAQAEAHPDRSPSSIAEELLGPLSQSLRLPRRDAGCLKRICGVQHRFAQHDADKRFRTAGFVHGPYFDESLQLFEVRVQAGGPGAAALNQWRDLADRAGRHAPADAFPDDGPDAAAEPELQDATPAEHESPPDSEHDVDAGLDAGVDLTPRDDGTESPDAGPIGEADPAFEDGGRRPRRRRRRGRGRGRRPDEPFQRHEDGDRLDALHATDAAERRARDPAPVDAEDAAAAGVPGSHHDASSIGDGDVPAAAGTDDGAPTGLDTCDDANDATDEDRLGSAEHPEQDPGRRRRRRRRGRRGRGRHDGDEGADRFPPSAAPAPHGEAIDAEAAHREPLVDDAAPLDPDAPTRTPAEPAMGDAGADAPMQEAAAAEATVEGEHRGDDRGGRRRRRRGRRGRGAKDRPDGDQPRAEQQHQHQQHPQQKNRGPQHPGQPAQGQQHGRHGRHQDRYDRRDQRRRDRGHGHATPRDVDVVPRYRDRRGKVDIIEPAALDLSAFDVELDPKRVPTFGSIVEGKNRPKKRTPRVPEDGIDDYKPPPPPGGGQGPSAPPPPPPKDDSDTFGDW